MQYLQDKLAYSRDSRQHRFAVDHDHLEPVAGFLHRDARAIGLHVLFTLFSEFRQNQHFKNQEANGNVNAGAPPDLA